MSENNRLSGKYNIKRFIKKIERETNDVEDIEKNVLVKRYNICKEKVIKKIPNDILEDPIINDSINLLPSNYNFEIHKTVWYIRRNGSKKVGLQMPEGLLVFACTISDILERVCMVDVFIMGDVTYGACCIDDFTAKALDCDLLIHYGHSCLIPVDSVSIKTLYIFVSIEINKNHVVETIKMNIPNDTHIALVGTIQFVPSIHSIRPLLENKSNYKITIPQSKPLSPGEILGCTAPVLHNDIDAIIYIGDGRFHLESIMIANPLLPAYKYDPYSGKFTREYYQHKDMKDHRKKAIEKAIKAKKWGLIIGTLGRQGSPKVMENLETQLKEKKIEYIKVLLSEIFPSKLSLFHDIEAWIQIACPRLSIDWGYSFPTPLLSPYEASVALNSIEWKNPYPMDFYANQSLGPWTPIHRQDQQHILPKIQTN
ncbi:hypothetical protein PNEG_03037 [Pneumocystis murina B123]|uniref:2-(3-amino-3-carboxypropyl)histidine synthase subunit 1 n=1 Tax=Pneumocystis murina (strain B123) TaxID=1069680 RepID=M7NMV2_PNEMU|nr:hypothetical protein PNEG_03037 [Pneumocystis murina B123]EMR08557.1 hypothetical protein PNEG_03037 [Pneumocystis murina B123]